MTLTGVRAGAGVGVGVAAWVEAHPVTPRMIKNGTRPESHPPLRCFPTKFRQFCIISPGIPIPESLRFAGHPCLEKPLNHLIFQLP